MWNAVKGYLYKYVRQGKTFRKILAGLKESEYYSREQLETLQGNKLQRLINHCYRNVPYYTDIFKQLGLKPEDIKTKSDLETLPFLDKQTINANFDKLQAKNRLKLLAYRARTSGTTGMPATFLRDYRSINFERAAMWRFWSNSGDSGLRRVVLRGADIIPIERTKPPFWVYSPADRELVMSVYHLSKDNAKAYIEKLQKFNPDTLSALPSAAYQLAVYCQDFGCEINLKVVYTTCELLPASYRSFIEKVFKCPIKDWYGQSERIAAIAQCEEGTYHILEDYSIVETVAANSSLEIVGTGLDNYLMPLVRYRTGDIIELGNCKCSCGRSFRTVEKFYGRDVDYVITPEGNKISLLLVSEAIDLAFVSNIGQIQFVQENVGELEVNIVKYNIQKPLEREKIVNLIKSRTSPEMVVKVNEVECIPRGANGKAVNVVQRVSR
jgi:phenylacetate-CoA ligase